jgi:membrane protein
VRRALRYFLDHDGFFLAAGLSFYVVTCIVPFLLLLLAGGAYLVSDEMALREILQRLAVLLPVYQSEIEAMMRDVVNARGVSSLIGTVVLVFFASQLFAATRLVLNRVFQRKGRSFIRGMLFDIGMIVLLTALFFVTVAITAAFAWVRGLALLFGKSAFLPAVFHWAGLLLAVLFNGALFVVLYRYVPTTRVGWNSVLAGSLATAVLWEIAKQAFRWYIEGIGVYSAVYGSFGVTIALMMWVYYSALVFVLGAALIRSLEERAARPAV